MNKRCNLCGRFMRKMWKKYDGMTYGEKHSYWCSNQNCENNGYIIVNP